VGELNPGLVAAMALGAFGLALMWASVMLAHALRTYSRSRLEEVCAAHGRPGRASAIAHHDEATGRGAEALAVLAALGLAGLLGALAHATPSSVRLEILLASALALAALGHALAGVIGRVFAERVLDAIWPLARPIRIMALPATLASGAIESLAYQIGAPPDEPPRPTSVEVEIHSAVDAEEVDETDLPEPTRHMLERVVELSRRDVSEVMTPRSAIVSMPATVNARQAARTFRETGRSRIPLFGENRDDIAGVLYSKDLFSKVEDGGGFEGVQVAGLVRRAFFVPESKNAGELLEEFRELRIQLAIVMDEYGGVAGLVTLEDLLEELVGPIHDEHDSADSDDPIVALGESRYEVDAAIDLDDLNQRLGLRLPTNGAFHTVGGFAFHMLGHLPDTGTSFRFGGAEFTVLQVSEHSIKRILVDQHPSEVAAPPAG